MALPGRLGRVANGNISPCRFVRYDATAGQAYDGRVIPVTVATQICAGISGESTHRAPYGALNDGYHAVAGENCMVYENGEFCLLELGGTVTRGDRLAPDANGKGLLAAINASSFAIAEASGVSGDRVPVKVTWQDGPGTT